MANPQMANAAAFAGRAEQWLLRAFHRLSQPANAARARFIVAALLLVWLAFGLARLIWALYPAEDVATAAPPGSVLNPVSGGAGAAQKPVDLAAMQAWHLFGEAGAEEAALAAAQAAEAQARAEREGIEDNARETRLALVLRGVASSPVEGEGHAIIEHKKQQAVYRVDDKLPVSGRVTLAKVLPDRVVLDNGGTYELLKLFEDDGLAAQVVTTPAPEPEEAEPQDPVVSDLRADADATAIATDYHQRLYENPQSLAEVVRVAAVRGDAGLRGYRVQPGTDREQFNKLGFKSGDIVTGINGVDLDNPGRAMELYQTLRTATEASFTVDRNGQPITLTVSLQGTSGQ